MRLLFVTPQAPWPPTQGTTLRNLHLLRAAAQRHAVDLLTFGTGDLPNPVRDLCGRVDMIPPPPRTALQRASDLARGWADMERRLWSSAFAQRLDERLSAGGYDALQLEGFEVAGYLLGPGPLRREAHDFSRVLPKLIFDDHNAEYELQRSAAAIDSSVPQRWPRAAYSWVQARRLRRREALYLCAADACLAVSAEDAASLSRIAPGVAPVVVPNGIDCSAAPDRVPDVAPTLLFSGKLDYRPNVDACEWLVRDIMPRVWAEVPDTRVVLAGRDPSAPVRALASQRVLVTGGLSEPELVAYRQAAWVYVVPMRMGSGVRFKVLEAMAAALPIVSTALGVAGTGAVDGEHALVRDDAERFARAVSELLRDGQRGRVLGIAARALAEREHDWRHITPRLLAVYDSLAATRPSPASAVATVLNERESVERLMSSLDQQSLPPEEVVIADGGSSDGTADVLETGRRTLAMRLVRAPGSNISQGRNRAIAEASHDTLLATDAGVTLHPRWSEHLRAALSCAGASPFRAAGGFFNSAPQSTWELALGATTLPDVAEIDPARFLPSSRSVAFTRMAWERAGRYPEWLDYCEDLVFDFGLIAAGAHPRWVPRAVAHFRPRRSPEAFFHQYFRYARGDGKADLWRRRHAIRYATYLGGAALALRVLRGDAYSLGLLALGSAAYLWRPFVRLCHQAATLSELLQAAPLLPVARLVGDVAKMSGYPVGVLWRWRNRRSLR